jgi:hypothetical protein
MARRLPAGQARDRINPMRLFVNDEEREQIKERAKEAGLTVSTFLRAAAMYAVRPRAMLDMKAVEAMVKVNADQGRLGGLLKMYLQDQKPDRAQAEQLLAQIQEVQTTLKAMVRTVQT